MTGLLSDVAGLSAPATELIKQVSNAVGGIAAPWQIRRIAKAEADADLIRAEGGMKVTELQARGIQRLVNEEGKNQANIESITMKAIPHLSADAKPEELNEDLLRYFFDKAKLISDEEMQTVWAKILAEQANQTSSFSRKTLDIVSHMDRQDAELFTRFCRNVWTMDDLVPFTETYFPPQRHPTDYSMSYSDMIKLEDIGLVKIGGAHGYTRTGYFNQGLLMYYGCPVVIDFSSLSHNSISIGGALLTKAGSELYKISGSLSSITAFECALEAIINQGIRVSIPIEAKEIYLQLA